MPGIRLFTHRFSFSSDDLTIPALIDIIFRIPLLIIYSIKAQSKCSSAFYKSYLYPLLIIYIFIAILAGIIAFVSVQGTPMNNIRPRRSMSILIYIRLILVLLDFGINVNGLVIIIRVFETCDRIVRGTMITCFVISCSTVIGLFGIFVFLIDLTGVISAENKWKMRLKFLFCCGRNYGGQSSDIGNIIRILQYLFDDERFDLVPSDVAVGLILLQEEYSIESGENVPLELLEEGFYYNSYAQSAFGWFSLAYQYRMTFLPRILFAMRFRTIACCCCCCCDFSCCQHPDSLYDPCGSQYSTLKYLLRRQKSVILYANFLDAFGRAPFYIAADEEKKTIIVSIRGTLSATDILTDINIVEDVFDTDLFGSGYCHSGMHSAANYIRDDISSRLSDIFIKYPEYDLVICGYSLGAGIAAILSVILKSRYPNLKCYGIAMPGSVLSKELAISTRDFIYSYVVDVDMIPRASINSLENLRDRIVDVLNQCHHCKFDVLTKLIKHQRDDYRLTSKFIQSIERQRLVLPGTIIHLISNDRARIRTYEDFSRLIVHPRMWLDHFPASYDRAFSKLHLVSCSTNVVNRSLD